MDLVNFAQTDDIIVEIKNPRTNEVLTDEDGTAVVVHFYNIDTPQYIKARNALLNEREKARFRNQMITVEQNLEMGLDFLASITKSWTRMPAFNEKLECTKENAKRVFGKIHWLRLQVDTVITQAGERTAFPTEGSSGP